MAAEMNVIPLARFLTARKFVPLPLIKTSTGHLGLAHAMVNGRAANLWLDTGAGQTVLDLKFARELGLSLTPDACRGAGAGGGGLTVLATVVSQLTLAGFTEFDFRCVAMDLDHVNASLKQRGLPPIDGIIGADLLERREAVIDYRASVLFLRRDSSDAA
jgi:hypothetical protein